MSAVLTAVSYADNSLTLHYDKPATYFEESLVIGNGTLGAIVYGGVDEERLSLNDITLWTGEPDTAVTNPDSYTFIPAIRQLLAEERYAEAERLDKMVQGHYSQNYQPLGTLTLRALNDDGHRQASEHDYRRTLDLRNATTTVEYGAFRREYFASAPDSVIVSHWTAKDGSTIDRRLSFHSLIQHHTTAYVINGDKTDRAPRRVVAHSPASGYSAEMCVDGYAGYTSLPSYYRKGSQHFWYNESRGIHYRVVVRVATDGIVTCPLGDEIDVRGASWMTIYATCVTSFNGADKNPVTEGREYREAALSRVDSAVACGLDGLRSRHIEDYASFFNRVNLELGSTPDSITMLPTDVQLRRYADLNESNPDLEELYFQYGRYLLIASSRTPRVPANLQGLWNEYVTPPWSANYTSNINVEENYWPALTGNLAEMHLPLLDFISQLPRTGCESARAYYGVKRGWSLGQNTDIWAMTCPVGMRSGDPSWACWTMGGTWLATHLWEHYTFTMDRQRLAKDYPVLRGAADFCIAWLVEKDGYLVTSPGTSPENKYKTTDGHVGSVLYGATADLAMIRECLLNTRAAARTLGIESQYCDTLTTIISRLQPYKIGKRGNLQEWFHDWDDSDPQHRHQSHLFGLYPGHHITTERTPDLARACARTLEIKGDNTTGWSTGWRVNLYARLHDGDAAYRIFRRLLSYVSPDDYHGVDAIHCGGTYPNLMDAHPPFQIDGNFGGTAGVMEMLVQSEMEPDGTSAVVLLPAVPAEWKRNGELRGIRVRGGMEIDMKWQDGNIEKLVVRSCRADRGHIKLRCGRSKWSATIAAGKEKRLK